MYVLTTCIINFWQKEINNKAFQNVLVKFTTEGRNQMSILPTFTKFYCMKVFCTAFMPLLLVFIICCQKEIGKEAAHKMGEGSIISLITLNTLDDRGAISGYVTNFD
jgi:hypothetical protein